MTLLFSLESNIGAGKSTLLDIIKSKFPNICIMQEPVDEWRNVANVDLLGKFYEDPKKWAFLFQFWVFITRVRKYEKILEECKKDGMENLIIIMERSWFTDRMCFAKNLRNSDKISRIEYEIYEKIFDFLIEKCDSISGYIYLNVDAEICAKRIIKRDRDCEKKINIDYLRQIEQSHDEWLIGKNNVLEIDANIDFRDIKKIGTQRILIDIDNFINSFSNKYSEYYLTQLCNIS